MKKKIKDLTLEEINKVCDKYLYCAQCPMFHNYTFCIKREEWLRAYLEQEVEVDE